MRVLLTSDQTVRGFVVVQDDTMIRALSACHNAYVFWNHEEKYWYCSDCKTVLINAPKHGASIANAIDPDLATWVAAWTGLDKKDFEIEVR